MVISEILYEIRWLKLHIQDIKYFFNDRIIGRITLQTAVLSTLFSSCIHVIRRTFQTKPSLNQTYLCKF